MNDAPPPLTPPECDLRDFPRMMIDITRLRSSEFDAHIDDAVWRAGLNLWFSAWHTVPAGSLPDEDSALAKAAGLGRDLKTWKSIRHDALRGFVKCNDGRLYHSTVCEIALECWLEKLVQRLSSGAGNAKRWGTEFDVNALEGDIDRAVAMLALLAPDSKALTKANRRRSQRNADGNPDGSPTGNEKPSRRDANNVPSGSQEEVEGKAHILPLKNAPDRSAQFTADQRAVIEAAGFASPPADMAMLASWQAAGADLEQDILPILRSVSSEVKSRTGKRPFRLQLFDPAIRSKLAADGDEIQRLQRVAKHIRRMDEELAQKEANA